MNRRYAVLILILVVLFNTFWGIGSVPLLDPDEPVYAETALEMIEFQDYLSPRIYNEFWYDKPPMYYWLVAGAFNSFGVSDAMARFPAALCGVLVVLAMYFSLRRALDEDTAFWSSLVLSTCIQFFYLSKAAVTDMTLLLFMTGALWCFWHEKYYPMYVCMALGTVTKGPIGIVFPGAIIFLYLVLFRQWRRFLEMRVVTGLLLYFLVAAPWYYLMYQAHGWEFLNTFLGFHNITRFTTPEHPTRAVWYYYIPVLLLGFFPWTGILPTSLWASLRESRQDEFRFLSFMHIWWIFVFAFFSITKTKLVSYILPLFPAIAVIVGWNVARLVQLREAQLSKKTQAFSLFMLALLAGGWIYAGIAFPEIAFAANILAGLTALLICAICCFYYAYHDLQLTFACFGAVGVVTMFVVFTNLLPVLAPRFSVHEVANYYKENCPVQANIYVDKFLRPGFMYYTRMPGQELKPKDLEKVAELAQNSTEDYVVVRGLEYRRWPQEVLAKTQRVYEKQDIYIVKL